jgi:hypothetical protein
MSRKPAEPARSPKKERGRDFEGAGASREKERERDAEARGLISIDGSALLSIAIIRLRIRNAKP